MEHANQVLDKADQDRCGRLERFASYVRQIKPDTEEDTILLIQIANHLSKRLGLCQQLRKLRGASDTAEYAASLLTMVHGHPDLKALTESNLEKWKIKNRPSPN